MRWDAALVGPAAFLMALYVVRVLAQEWNRFQQDRKKRGR